MNREVELQHLVTADVHMAQGERVISGQMAHLEKMRADGHDTKLAEETLRVFEANLQMMREHRETIIKTIELIDQGA